MGMGVLFWRAPNLNQFPPNRDGGTGSGIKNTNNNGGQAGGGTNNNGGQDDTNNNGGGQDGQDDTNNNGGGQASVSDSVTEPGGKQKLIAPHCFEQCQPANSSLSVCSTPQKSR